MKNTVSIFGVERLILKKPAIDDTPSVELIKT